MAAARWILALACPTALVLLGAVLAADARVSPLAVVGLVVAGGAIAGAIPASRAPRHPESQSACDLEDAWIETMNATPHLFLERRPELGWELHAVHVDQQGARVRLRHLVNTIRERADDGTPLATRIRVAEQRDFAGDQVVEASLALDEMREAAAHAEERSRTGTFEQEERRVRREQEALERAAREEADRREVARRADLARYRAELEQRLAAERAALERRDAEREARGLVEALRGSRHPGAR
jgi:hypothetical protein